MKKGTKRSLGYSSKEKEIKHTPLISNLQDGLLDMNCSVLTIQLAFGKYLKIQL